MNKERTYDEITPDEVEFLKESNAIEGVEDPQSLEHAVYAWRYLKEQPRLTNTVVLTTHKVLMANQPIAPRERGFYRGRDVWIGGRKALLANTIPYLMDNWLRKANKLGDVKAAHVAFERIHPFIDGNGRVGRMLMNWQRIKKGQPVVVIKAKERQKYYQWFRDDYNITEYFESKTL